MRILIRITIPLVIVFAGYLGMKRLAGGDGANDEVPDGRPSMIGKREAQKVEGILLKRENFEVTLSSQGVVQAHNSTSLTPRVSGRVLKIHENFENGAFFSAGTVLIELDPVDFESSLASAEAQLARAEAELVQELARAEQALLDWRDLGYEDEPGDLVLRKPQLKEAEANVKAAQASLMKATRDLNHTKVLAPYDGCVLERNVGPGQSVGVNTTLGSVFSTDYAEVRLPLNAADLNFIELSNGNFTSEIPVTLSDAITPDSPLRWQGRLMRSEGVLDTASRELFVVARVEDPYGLSSNKPPLRVGLPVTAKISGITLPDVFVIPRDSLRGPNQVVVVDPEDSSTLRKDIEPVWSGPEELVVNQGLDDGWWLITSTLPFAANGSKVEVSEAGSLGNDGDPPNSAQTLENTPGA